MQGGGLLARGGTSIIANGEPKAPKEPKPPKEPKAPKAAKHLFQSKPDGKKQTSMMSFFAKKA